MASEATSSAPGASFIGVKCFTCMYELDKERREGGEGGGEREWEGGGEGGRAKWLKPTL